DSVNAGGPGSCRFIESKAGERLVGCAEQCIQINGGRVKSGIVWASRSGSGGEINAIHALQRKTGIEKPILRVVVGDERTAIAEVQSDIGRASAAARIGDESDAQVNGWRSQRERSRGKPGSTA